MIVIFTLLLTTVLANSYERYIDLLPEKEKQLFLDKVARRIMESVDNTDGGNKSSRELTDEELKGHSKFVQEILKQESAHYRRRRDNNKSSEGEDAAEENLEVKPLSTAQNVNNESVSVVTISANNNPNLPVNKVKRRSYDDTHQETPSNYIKVEIVTEDSLPMQKRLVGTDGESNEEAVKQSSSTNSKEKEIPSDKLNKSETLTAGSEEMKSVTKFPDIQDFFSTTDKFEENYKILRATGSSQEDNSDLKHKSAAETTIKPNAAVDFDSDKIITSVVAENKTKLQINDSSVESKSSENNTNEGELTTTNEYLENVSIIDTEFDIQNKNSKSLFDATSEKSSLINLDEYVTPPERASQLDIATTVNYPEVPRNPVPKIAITSSTETTKVLSAFTPTNIEKQATKSSKQSRVKKIVKHSENTTFISYIAGNALKKVKSKYDLYKKSNPIIQNKYKMNTGSDNLQPYQIYEIPWPESSDVSPFLRSPEPMKDSPFYVPVYKYSPNYAYYNPTNRLGPNAVEDNTIEIDTRPLRKGEYKIGKKSVPEFVLQFDNERKFGQYKKENKQHEKKIALPTSISSNDSECEDDGSSNIRFPDSHEKLHPINNMKNGLKTHIRAIRDILFKNKRFGADEPFKKKEYITHLYGNTDIWDKYVLNNVTEKKPVEKESKLDEMLRMNTNLRARYDHNQDIDIDYYFDRINRIHQKNNKKYKNLHHLKDKYKHNLQKKDKALILNYLDDRQNRETVDRKDVEPDDLDAISKALSQAGDKDVFINVQKMPELHFKLIRKSEDGKVDLYMKVLKDLIEKDSKALKQYDWLATTVQVQSALQKLFQLIEMTRQSKPLHPADLQILKYTIFIMKFSTELKDAYHFKSKLRKTVKLLPRNKRKKKDDKILKEKGLLNRVWLYLRAPVPDFNDSEGLNDLNEFLLDVQKALFDLHDAITNISKVTKFKHQNWFENLKELYLTTSEKHLREVLLHVTFARLVELMENSCENGLENDFIGYLKTHKKESKRTLEEMVFVSKIVDEIKLHM